MIKVGYLFTVLLLLFFTVNLVSAQSHITTAGSLCRYAKNSLRAKHINWEGHLQCPACDKDDAKEAIARKAEDKRRQEAKDVANAATDLAKKQALEAEEKRKRDAKKGVTEVFVTMPANKTTQSSPPANAAVTDPEMVKNYFYAPGEFDNQSPGHMSFSLNEGDRNGSTHHLYSDENYFIVNNKKILNNDEFKVCVGVREIKIYGNNPTNFPPNIGIVILNESADGHAISDLTDATGKRLLNDNNISTIVHFVDDYFILLKGKYFTTGYPSTTYHFDDGVIYNHKTKERHTMRKYQYANGDSRLKIESKLNVARIGSKKTRNKGTYKALVTTETAYRKATIYYITNDGKVESDEFDY